MNERKKAVETSRRKLDEAKFFLNELKRAEGLELLETAEHQFQHNLSAFLTATRSAVQIISSFEGTAKGSEKDDWAWTDEAKKGWTPREVNLERAFKNLRDDNVHRGIVAVDSTIEYVPEWQHAFRERRQVDGCASFFGPPGTPPPLTGVMRFTIRITDEPHSAAACAKEYLMIIERMIDHYEAAHGLMN